MTMIMLKEKPYIRIVDENQPSHTTRLKLSEESWERFKEWDQESPDEIPVAQDFVMWECENCRKQIAVGNGWEQRSVHDAIVNYGTPCEEMSYKPLSRGEHEGVRLKVQKV